MSDPADPQAWVAKAEEDYSVARSILRRKLPPTSIACFHAQQCAEKYIKGMLVSRGKSFPKIHDLLELSTLCEKAGILLAVDTLLLHNLTIYAVQVRYPGDDPTLEEAKEAVPTAKFIRKLSRKFLGVE